MKPQDKFRATAPAVSLMTAFTLPAVRRRLLPSGIEIIIYDRCDEPVNYMTLVQPGGDCEFPSPGYSALNAVMRREGTRSYSGEEINSLLDFNGSWLNISSSGHHLSLAMRSLNSTLPSSLPVFKEMAFNPVFPEKALEVRRASLARNIEVALTDVDFMAMAASDALIKGKGHPGARIDTPQEIREITSKSLADAFAANFHPESSKIFLSGMITREVEESVAEIFSDIPKGNSSYKANIVPFHAAPAGTVEKIVKKDAKQSSIVITLPAIGRNHPDYIPLHIAVSALGGYFGSRLMLEIRERLGLTYGISASLLGSEEGAYIQIQADTDCSNVERLCDEVKKELLKMVSQPPADSELTRLRQSLLSSQAAILDSPFSIIDYHISRLTASIPDGYFEEKLNAITQLTPETISRVAAKYFKPDELRTAIAGRNS